MSEYQRGTEFRLGTGFPRGLGLLPIYLVRERTNGPPHRGSSELDSFLDDYGIEPVITDRGLWQFFPMVIKINNLMLLFHIQNMLLKLLYKTRKMYEAQTRQTCVRQTPLRKYESNRYALRVGKAGLQYAAGWPGRHDPTR